MLNGNYCLKQWKILFLRSFIKSYNFPIIIKNINIIKIEIIITKKQIIEIIKITIKKKKSIIIKTKINTTIKYY